MALEYRNAVKSESELDSYLSSLATDGFEIVGFVQHKDMVPERELRFRIVSMKDTDKNSAYTQLISGTLNVSIT